MARIRSIKPEFPQSESMGRVSRNARLLFVQIWTICDDEGRTRGNSRMLASLLFPYDDDAPSLIDDWVTELEREECIVRYQVSGQTYIQVCNWLTHQRIDKPSPSKIPKFDESSRILANPREPSTLELELELEGNGKEGRGEEPHAPPTATPIPISEIEKPKNGTRLATDWDLPEEWGRWAEKERGLNPKQVIAIADQFKDWWIAKPGKEGRKLDWEATWRNWVRSTDLKRIAA